MDVARSRFTDEIDAAAEALQEFTAALDTATRSAGAGGGALEGGASSGVGRREGGGRETSIAGRARGLAMGAATAAGAAGAGLLTAGGLSALNAFAAAPRGGGFEAAGNSFLTSTLSLLSKAPGSQLLGIKDFSLYNSVLQEVAGPAGALAEAGLQTDEADLRQTAEIVFQRQQRRLRSFESAQRAVNAVLPNEILPGAAGSEEMAAGIGKILEQTAPYRGLMESINASIESIKQRIGG